MFIMSSPGSLNPFSTSLFLDILSLLVALWLLVENAILINNYRIIIIHNEKEEEP